MQTHCRNSPTCKTFTAQCDGKICIHSSESLRQSTTASSAFPLCRFFDIGRINGVKLTVPYRPSDGTGELRFPKFKHLTQFSYSANGGNPTEVYEFLARNKGSIRSIHLQNLNWSFPSDVISIRNLTHLDFLGTFQADSRALAEVLHNGHQLESLRLQCMLECSASVQFRDFASSLPFLRHFSLTILGYRVNDHDFFPALSDFLRGRTQLRTLQLIVPSADYAHRRLGYDANVWGVLPSLMHLQSLSATLPKDVAAAVAMWLVPRSVQCLSLHNLSTESVVSYVSVSFRSLPHPRTLSVNSIISSNCGQVCRLGSSSLGSPSHKLMMSLR